MGEINQQLFSIDALVPRGLVSGSADLIRVPISSDGLCPLRICWNEGVITSLQGLDDSVPRPNQIILPRLSEPHTHLDKAFSWSETPNFNGTYINAFSQNLKEHQSRTSLKVHERAEVSMNLALRNGIRAIRTHVDSFGPHAEMTWEVLLDVQKKWKRLIELQLVALVPLDFWSTDNGLLMAKKLATVGGLLGGVLVPPFDRRKSSENLRRMVQLAYQFDLDIDLHIDESDNQPAAGIKSLLTVLDKTRTRVNITCSHASSLSLLRSEQLRCLASRIAEHQINIVALPLTNFWLLGRKPRHTPIQRSFAPVCQLQEAGIDVAIGSDNIQDPWFPLGNLDPLSLMAFSLPLTQLAPWDRRGLAPFTTASARLMNLSWDGVIKPGNPVELILLEGSSWVDLLANLSSRKIINRGVLLEDELI